MAIPGQDSQPDAVESLYVKLDRHGAFAPRAIGELAKWLEEYRHEILGYAKGRHIWGHFRYGDKNFSEYDVDRLNAEILEELADAVNYMSRRLYLLGELERGAK